MKDTPMRDWLLCRVPPEVYAAVESAAADTWQRAPDYVRQAVVARLRAEGRLEPRPVRKVTEIRAAP